MAQEPAHQQMLHDAAESVAAAARTLAPDETGAYRDSFEVDGNRVISTDPFDHLIEYGSANNRIYAVKRRAVRAAGLRLDESPKS